MLLNWRCLMLLGQAPLVHSCPEFIRPLPELQPLEILHTNKILTNLHPRWGVSGSCCYRNPLPSPGSWLQLQKERLEASLVPSPSGIGTSHGVRPARHGLNPVLLPEVPLYEGCMEDVVSTTTTSQPASPVFLQALPFAPSITKGSSLPSTLPQKPLISWSQGAA